MTAARLIRRPRVGDRIELAMGSATVTAVHDHGRRLDVTDRLGRVWYPERAENGHWTRSAVTNPAEEAP